MEDIKLDAIKKSMSNRSMHDPEAKKNVNADTSDLERKTLRRVDFRLLPMLGLLYCFAIVDITNLGLARIAGMDEDLHMAIGSRFNVISCVYFVPSILAQLPSNLILRALGARLWLTFGTISWGIVTLSVGFVRSWGYLVLCRILLGLFEASLSPAVVFIVQTWYTRYEVQQRLAFFSLFTTLPTAFGPILAYALSKLDGRQGLSGWSWIFIIEGLVTICLSVVSWFFITDFPDKNDFLTEQQTKLILKRIDDDRGDAIPDQMTWPKLLKHLADWKIWVYGLMFMSAIVPAYAIGLFMTIILSGMGWDTTQSLLLTAPPYILASGSVILFAWLSDKYRRRAVFLAIQALMTIIGLVTTAYTQLPSWRYLGIFLVAAGSSGCVPGILAHASNNVVSHTKRSVSSAIIVTFGGVGGIFASAVFREQDFPTYIPGIWATIGCQFLLLFLLLFATLYFRYKNGQTERAELMEPLEGQPGFLYTL